MKLRKPLKTLALILSISSIALMILANRDLDRIYGGLTQTVDTKQFKPYQGPMVIENVNVLSPDGEYFEAGQTVMIENSMIVSVDSALVTSDQIRTIDGTGKYLIPGLVDSHVHLFKSPNDLLLYVANGVTQVRELIGEEDHLDWRAEIKNGRLGPDMFIASPRIGSFATIEGFFMSWSQGFLNINTATEAESAVKKLHQQGYDAVKIYSQINKETYFAVSKIAMSLGMKVVGHVPWSIGLPDLYPNQNGIAHLEEVMNSFNREFGGFNPKLGKPWDFSGFDAGTAEEFLAYVEKRSNEVASDLVKNNISVATTLWLVESFIRQKLDLARMLTNVELEYVNPGISEWSSTVPRGLGWLPEVSRYAWPDDFTQERKTISKKYWETYAKACQIILKTFANQGVKILAGTDANLPVAVAGFSLHDELISLNKAGMTPAQVLKAATAQPAKWLNNNAGEILPGRKANLVLLDKNPLSDISNTKTINSVFLNGKLLDRALLDQMLAAVRVANNSSRKEDISAYLN